MQSILLSSIVVSTLNPSLILITKFYVLPDGSLVQREVYRMEYLPEA